MSTVTNLKNNWDSLSQLNNLRSVIDPHDERGFKNLLIDQIQWNALKKQLIHSEQLLDFGCGIGRFARRIKALGISYTGIDTSMAMIRRARQTNSDAVTFEHFDGSTISRKDSSFDTVMFCGVLTYNLKTDEGKRALSEAHRVLTPQGRLIILEEASISGRKSESAGDVLTEQDYSKAVSELFDIRHTARVRSPDFSKLTCRILDSSKMSMTLFKVLLRPLAGLETKIVERATDAYFKTTSYYDFVLEAVVRKK